MTEGAFRTGFQTVPHKIPRPMKKSLLILAIFICSPGHAQDYMNICIPGVTTYRDIPGNLKAFRYDSLRTTGSGDTIFVSFPAIRDIPGHDYLDTAAGGILGRRIIRRQDGWLLFFNQYGDTIRINARAAVSDSWKLSALPGGGSMMATLNAVGAENILGTDDSVKTIILQATDSLGNPVAHPFNGKSIRLTKYSGLVQLCDLWTFPGDTTRYALAGKTHGHKGIQPLRMREVYDFDPGDELHFLHITQGSVYLGPYTETKCIWTILDRAYLPDSSVVTYRIKNCRHSEYTSTPPPIITVSNLRDTISMTYDFPALEEAYSFDRLPGEFFCNIVNSQYRYARRYSCSVTSFSGTDRRTNGVYDSWYVSGPVTGYRWQDYGLAFHHNPDIFFGFAEGMGMTANINRMYTPVDDSTLVFYRGDTVTWGSRVAADCSALLGVNNLVAPAGMVIRVMPNPVVTRAGITIEGLRSTNPVTCIVRDAPGRFVSCQVFPPHAILFDRTGLNVGLYFISLLDDRGAVLGHIKVMVTDL